MHYTAEVDDDWTEEMDGGNYDSSEDVKVDVPVKRKRGRPRRVSLK